MGPQSRIGRAQHLADRVVAARLRRHPPQPLLQLQLDLWIPMRRAHPLHLAVWPHQVHQTAVRRVRHQQPRQRRNHVLQLQRGCECVTRLGQEPEPALLSLALGDVVGKSHDAGDGTVRRVQRRLGGFKHDLLPRLEAKDFLRPQWLAGRHDLEIMGSHQRRRLGHQQVAVGTAQHAGTVTLQQGARTGAEQHVAAVRVLGVDRIACLRHDRPDQFTLAPGVGLASPLLGHVARVHHIAFIGAHESGGQHPTQRRNQRLEFLVAGAEVGAHRRLVEGRAAQLRYGVPHDLADQCVARESQQLGIIACAAVEVGAPPVGVEAHHQLADPVKDRFRRRRGRRRLRRRGHAAPCLGRGSTTKRRRTRRARINHGATEDTEISSCCCCGRAGRDVASERHPQREQFSV